MRGGREMEACYIVTVVCVTLVILAWMSGRAKEDREGNGMAQRTEKAKGFWEEWEETRLCASLIREGKARIVTGKGSDGGIVRYTEPYGNPDKKG